MATIDKDRLIEDLIKNYGDDILRICYLYTKDYLQAEDLFQEVFIKVYKNIERFNNQCEVSTWIIKIAINTCKDYLKSAWIKRNILFWSIEEENNENTENQAILDIEKDYILSSVLNLPSKYREVIYFYYYKGLKTKEIAEVLKIKESVVRSRLMRAREILKRELKEGLAYEEWF